MKIVRFFIVLVLISFLYSAKKTSMYKGFNLKEFEKSLVLVPSQTYGYGLSDEDMSFISHPERYQTVHVDSFYISKYEVSNGQYLDFLSEIRLTDTVLYASLLPDTLVWRRKDFHSEALVEYYLRHPTYSSYPVVGISYRQAEKFCKWLTEKYMKDEKRKFKNVEFKLPTRFQWTLAASAGGTQREFPWEGRAMQNQKGQWLANFRVIEQYTIGAKYFEVKKWNGEYQKEVYDVSRLSLVNLPDAVKSYFPNGYGLYNMAGNVEEYVMEEGLTKGGSWNDTGYYLRNHVTKHYDSTQITSAERGFRFVMELKK